MSELKSLRGLSQHVRDGAHWRVPVTQNAEGTQAAQGEDIQLIYLAAILEELKRLNGLLHCRNFQNMPHTLTRIDKRIAKKVKLR